MFKNVGKMLGHAATPFRASFPAFQPIRRFSKSAELLKEKVNIDLTPLKLSNELYAIFRIHNRPYLVTKGDTVTLPFKLKQAEIGDILNLEDVTTIGSRNYKLACG